MESCSRDNRPVKGNIRPQPVPAWCSHYYHFRIGSLRRSLLYGCLLTLPKLHIRCRCSRWLFRVPLILLATGNIDSALRIYHVPTFSSTPCLVASICEATAGLNLVSRIHVSFYSMPSMDVPGRAHAQEVTDDATSSYGATTRFTYIQVPRKHNVVRTTGHELSTRTFLFPHRSRLEG